MSQETPQSPGDSDAEIAALIETLHRTGQRLEALTAGEVDSVADRDGRTFLLQNAQDHLRHSEAAKQAAILNVLPAHIALLDTQGRIVSVNEAWRQFADANALRSPDYGIGLNYLDVCDSARDDAALEARQAAAGIRALLAGEAKRFSLEYSCHSASEQRWFLMTATPLADDHPNGVVVMHVDVGAQKQAEIGIKRLNRVYAVLSGINGLIVRVRDRDELFREACRIAAEAGFPLVWLGILDPQAAKIVPVAWHGAEQDYLHRMPLALSDTDSLPVRALKERKVMIGNDMRENPYPALREEALKRGFKSMIVLPLLVVDQAVGVLTLYAGEFGYFNDDEIKLLRELADDIAFAIDHIEKQERLDYFAYYDALTGLANRSLFLERVAQYMRIAASGGHKLAVFLIDLERFNSLNDSLGRPAGDALLRQAAAWLTHSAGDANLTARLGSDHFAVVLPEVWRDGDLARFIENKISAFLEHPFRLNDAVFRIAIKVGGALFPDDGTEAETLLRNAEAALKNAKKQGERYLFYTQKMTETVAGKLTLENHLRQAVDNGEFVLHYQPKVNLASGKLSSAEALIRWNNPRTGLVPPDQFIPILEEIGLIQEVGRWALRQAIADTLRWRGAGLPAVRIAVNVSPLQLRHRGFIAEIGQTIGIDAHAAEGLELEITESLLMEDVKHSIASLQAIRAMGVSIAIDDFGTGFSSLSYLSKLPVDTLKIDRSFVIDMTVTPEGLALVSTIINLAHALKLKVVAEGVETEEQSRLLRLLDCDEIQGFLFSKPVPGEIFESRFLAAPA
ncbi:MAG: hypothetical protein B7Y41_00315 [Hydrogenophilales bacterium 28-61-23]|nr:MAG: hypothetical protein B7Y41_00315 [Hydrogenophilales bacterium 28-61-23]